MAGKQTEPVPFTCCAQIPGILHVYHAIPRFVIFIRAVLFLNHS